MTLNLTKLPKDYTYNQITLT